MTYEEYENDVPTSYGSGESRDMPSDVSEIRGEMSDAAAAPAAERAPEPMERSGFFKNIAGSIGRNPLPLAMIAGGVGYLVYNELQARKQPTSQPTSMRERVDASLKHETASSAPGAFSRVRELTHDVGESVGAAAGRLGDAARELSHDASTLTGEAAGAARSAARKGQELLLDRPLVLAGLGLALGAAVAGTAPISRREQDLMAGPAGEAIDNFVHGAQQLKQRAKESVGALGQAAKHEAAVLMSSTEQIGGEADGRPSTQADTDRDP